MTTTAPREHYIPLRRTDLVHLMATEPSLGAEKATLFRLWADLFSATLHFKYKRLYDDLKDTYAQFDPESTTVPLQKFAAEDRQAVLDELFRRFDELLLKANFVPLSREDIMVAAKNHSAWGVDMSVDFTLFEKFQIYMRGDIVGKRSKRTWFGLGKDIELDVPTYQRLVVMVKLAKSDRFPTNIDTDDVFVKFFKDIPKADIEMLLPGARVVMPGTQRLKLGGSLLSSSALIGYNLLKPVLASAVLGVQYFYGMIFGLLGYGWRQYAGYQSTRHAISLRLTESLYFQNLANNAGVLFCLLDEAEEQDAREAILAYFFLWHVAGPTGWTIGELDVAIEKSLEARAGLQVDFEVDDSLAKLEAMNLVTRHGERFVAVPIEAALAALDHAWDNNFQYHKAEAAA